jgi:uncharacterized protein
MKFAEDHNSSRYKITGYDNTSIGINGIAHHQSLILSPMDLIHDWTPERYSLLEATHLDPFYDLKAEIILLGTGPSQIFPQQDILRRFANEQIGFEIMDTQAACRTFNILMAEGRNVVAGLFIE